MLSGYKSFIVAGMMVLSGLMAGYSNVDGIASYDMAFIDWGMVMEGSGFAAIREALRKGWKV